MNSFKIPFYSFFAAIILGFSLFSCTTPLKEVTYLHNIETDKTYPADEVSGQYTIKPNDHLFIRVITDNPQNAAFLNLSSGTLGGSGVGIELITYMVDNKGLINYPYLGEIEVKDKTALEVQQIIQEKVKNYLTNAAVYVKIVNRIVTVLGEVSNPGQHTMNKNRVTIFEALGLAGDITDYGNRKTVKIIRELEDGKKIESIDLTNPDFIYSPYYYVLPHDIVYVEPATRLYGAKNLGFAAPLSITASVISIGLLFFNLFN